MDTREKLSKIRLDPSEKVGQKGSGSSSPIFKLALWALGAVVLILLLLLWFRDGAEDVPVEALAGKAPTAPQTSSSSGDRTLSAGGYVEARRTALVWPGREGIVAEVHVVRGQEVEKDQVLLELDARAPAAALEMARAELEEARAVMARIREGSRAEELTAARAEVQEAEVLLAEAEVERDRLLRLESSGLVTLAEVDTARFRADAAAARLETLQSKERMAQEGNRPSEIAEAEAEVARKEAAVRAAEVGLDLTRVRAPFAGVVIGIELEPGEVVSLFDVRSGVEIADESELWVRVDVPESRLSGLEIGDSALVISQAIGSERLTARVVEIAPKADRQSNTVEVAVAIDDPPPLLRPDMSARVEITLAGESE
jgi:multidrug resistance efflux pump